MREILFLSHRIPFPPDRGDKIRSHHILRRLARIAPVHVATFADDELDLGEEAELAAIARTYRLVSRTKPLPLAGVEALFKRSPVSLTAFYSDELADYVGRLLADHPISTIYVFSGQMGQYIPADYQGRVVIDFVDVDSAKFEAYSSNDNMLMRWVDAREARLLSAEEARLAQRADVNLLVSAAEAELFAKRLPDDSRSQCDVRVLGNGIDSSFFDPSGVRPEPLLEQFPGPKMIFTGQMDYGPNVAAALRAADRILPRIRESIPEATFHVVGRRPVSALQDRDGINGCHVWGRVEDIRPWMKAADLALVPLEIARGIQNKVLEAMSMCLPTVVSIGAGTGIGAVDGGQFAIGDSDDELAARAVALLSDPIAAQTMGHAARNFVSGRFGWNAMLEPLARIVGEPAPANRHAA